MIDHYNAFISYRHSEKDSAIAEEVQHRLERYRLPKAIQKRIGRSRLGRVFRDKEELPITSDLNDDISYALEHSDFLIVICSVRTKESVWVEREIRYFLRTHSKKQVLTVLVDGEPYDVIPELLLNDEVEVLREDGTRELVKEAIEPLSCDYRIPIRRARREELPRLAAALLGCSYDELVERERQYRRRRATAIASLAGLMLTIAVSYLTWSLVQIRKNYELAQSNYRLAQENYDLAQANYEKAEENYQEAVANLEQSQRNQSVNLANQSLSLLSSHNRIDAILLALAALPGEENPRPLVAEAEFALAESVGAYIVPDANNIAFTWNYSTGSRVSDYMVNKKYLVARDSSDLVYCWDIATHNLLWKQTVDGVNGFTFTGEDRLAVSSSKGLYGLDALTGQEQWRVEEEDYSSMREVQKAESGLYVMDSAGTLTRVDPATGQITGTWEMGEISGVESYLVREFRVSPGGTRVLTALYLQGNAYRVAVMDLQTGAVTVEKQDRELISDLCVPDEDTVIIGEHPDIMAGTSAMGSYMFVSESTINVVAMDPDDLRIRWTRQVTSSQLATDSDMYSQDYTDPAGNSQPCVIYYLGEKIEIFRISDGQTVGSYSIGDSAVNVTPSVDGGITILTGGGRMGAVSESYGVEGIALIQHFPEGLDQAILSRGAYVHKAGASEIIYYSPDLHDEEIGSFEDMIAADYLRDAYATDHYAVVWADGATGLELGIYDAAEKKQLFRCSLEGVERASDVKMLGEYDGRVLLCYVVKHDVLEQDLVFVSIDPGTGDQEKMTLLEGKASYSSVDDCALQNGVLYYLTNPAYHEYVLCAYDLKEGTTKDYPLDSGDAFLSCKGIHASDGGRSLFLEMEEDSLWFFPDTGAMIRPSMEDLMTGSITAAAVSSDDSALALSDDMTLAVYGKDGKLNWKMDLVGIGVLSLYEHEGILYAALADDTLRGYRLEDGSQVGTVDVGELSSRTLGRNSWYMDDEKGLLYVSLGNAMTVVDTGRWADTCMIYLCTGYVPSADIFLMKIDNEDGMDTVGWFRHYSVEELKVKAEKLLGDTVLSQEKKMMYGLE